MIFHDGCKLGYTDDTKKSYTTYDHPILMANKLEELKPQLVPQYWTEDDFNKIKSCVASHSGQWNKDKDGNVITPLPSNSLELAVHLSDFISSRNYLEMNFDKISLL